MTGASSVRTPSAVGDLREPEELVAVVRARVDPRTARGKPLEHAVVTAEDVLDDLRGRQAGEDGVGGGRHLLRGRRPDGTRLDERRGRGLVAVVDGEREPGPEQARRKMPPEIAEPDEAEALHGGSFRQRRIRG